MSNEPTNKQIYEYYNKKADNVVLSREQLIDLLKVEENHVSETKGSFVPNIAIDLFRVDIADLQNPTSFLFIKTNTTIELGNLWMVWGKQHNSLVRFATLLRTPDGYVRVTPYYETFSSEEEAESVTPISCLLFAAIQNRLSYTDDFDVEEKKVTTSAKKKKKGKKAYTQHKVRLYKCYTLTRVAPVKNLHKKKVVITCPAWGVRGHYRHYKSGKVVFISPYTKGKDRNNYQPKEYGLFRPTKGGKENEINRTALSV